MFKHRINGASGDTVNRASGACIACSDGWPLHWLYFVSYAVLFLKRQYIINCWNMCGANSDCVYVHWYVSI